MKKTIILLIMGGILLVLSLDAKAGITYPRNRVSIQDTRLQDWPWEPVLSNSTTRSFIAISPGTRERAETESRDAIFVLTVRLIYYRISRLLSTYWIANSLDDEKSYAEWSIIRD